MSSENDSNGGASQSFADKTVSTTVVDEIIYEGSRVYVYGLNANDLANKQEPFKWIFYYVPLFKPVYQQSLGDTKNWVVLTRYNKLKIRLCQGNVALEKMIRDSLAKKESEFSAAYASSWTIKPLMIDSFTAYIVNGKEVVPGIKPCRVDNPESIEISLSFGLMSQDEDHANEMVKRIQDGDYQIQLSIEYAGFSRSTQNVVSYSFESIQDALSNTLVAGPSEPKYILKNQKSWLVQQVSSKVEESVMTGINDKPTELKRLSSMLTGFIELSLSKAQEMKVEMSQLANVWSTDDLKPDFIELEVNKLFKYDKSETKIRRDGSNYFRSNIPADVDIVCLKLGQGFKENHSFGEKFTNELQNQIKNKNQDHFSEADIKKLLEKNSVEVEWDGQKFVGKSITVVKIAEIVPNITASVVSKQIELEKQAGLLIKKVNHEIIADSEFIIRSQTTTNHQNVKVDVDRKKLSEERLDIIAAISHMSREEIQMWHKQFLVEFPDGYIKETKFVEIYKKLFRHGNPEKFAKFAFLAFDQDRNGKIEFDEFIIASSFSLKQGATREQEKERLNLLFSIFDINHDGTIDISELTKLYNAIAELKGKDNADAKKKMNDLLERYDKDKSGSLNKEEFVCALQNENVFHFFK